MKKDELKEKILALEIEALEKWNNGNPSGYLELYSEDITYFDPFQEKRFDGKEKMTAFYEELRGKGKVDRYEIIDPQVQALGNVAVLTYNLESYAGEKLFKWNCTEVYRQKDNEQWEIIHNHWSLVKPISL